MLLRYVNAIAVFALLGSAAYAYSIKYETILYSAKIQKLKNANSKQVDQIGLLRAEWAHLSRPERIQALSDKHLKLQQLQLSQIVSFKELPERPPKTDFIGRKLKLLGLDAPTATPGSGVKTKTGATPSSTTPGSQR
jgi:cell division protein FtsL